MAGCDPYETGLPLSSTFPMTPLPVREAKDTPPPSVRYRPKADVKGNGESRPCSGTYRPRTIFALRPLPPLEGRMSQESSVVVFDFDLTLTRWDTADRFFRWLLRRDPWRCATVIAALPLLGPLLLLRSTRKWPIRFAVWVATLGRTSDDLSELAEEHIQSLPSGHVSVFLPAAVERLQAHVAGGDRVVIATGCVDGLARALLQRAGLGGIPLVASSLRPFLGGLVRDQHCFGSNKIPMLSARGFAPPWAVAYTDHQVDLPVLQLSAKRFLVSPKPKCLARIEQALATKVTVLAWR
jgi:phosphatidylglycerophosphatase C